LQYINNEIIIKTRVRLWSGIGDHSRFWLSCLGPYGFLLPKTLRW